MKRIMSYILLCSLILSLISPATINAQTISIDNIEQETEYKDFNDM